ncbi:hypothetical protein G7054_g12620 [Neopestalotiopsis clavispora]|nr:hypothetical protein G7054_g12620 [Neopestalotiopsis clavispora]
MNRANTERQVIIVGGGLVGLTLALMLQQIQVEYILLEAYESVTPRQGAIIALHANGLRIMDQLGLYEEIQAKGQLTQSQILRDSRSGALITKLQIQSILRERHGYSNIFLSRHILLGIIYGQIREKERILVHQKVISIDHQSDHVLVNTQDGSVFRGQIVIGTDGVHSTIRKEIWRLANETDPSLIPAEDLDSVACEHACLFGVADAIPEIPAGDMVAVSGHGTTAACCSASGEAFFFWFWALPRGQRSCSIDSIPPITDKMKQEELLRAGKEILTDGGLTFRTVLERARFSACTALPHYVLKRWHFGRVMVIGDAAHKFNPLVGQGGNSGPESCAALVNAMQRAGFDTGDNIDTDDVEEMFQSVQNQRIGRLLKMVEQSQKAMRNSAWQSSVAMLVRNYVTPYLPTTVFADAYSYYFTPSISLDNFDSPYRTHSRPYNDEMVSSGKGSAKAIYTGTFCAVTAALLIPLVRAMMRGRQIK